jgi:hypothetical protein
MRALPLVIAILALTGIERDINRSAFSPLQILESIRPAGPDHPEAHAAPDGEARVSARWDLSAERVPPNAKQPVRPKNRSKLHPLAETYDKVAVRSKPYSRALTLFGLSSSSVRSLNVVLPGYGREHHLHLSQRAASAPHLVCRMRC